MTDLGDKILALRNTCFQYARSDRELGDVLTKTMDLLSVVESRAFDDNEEMSDSVSLLRTSIERQRPRDPNRDDTLRSIVYGIGELMGPLFMGLMDKLNGVPPTEAEINSTNQVEEAMRDFNGARPSFQSQQATRRNTIRPSSSGSVVILPGSAAAIDTLPALLPGVIKQEDHSNDHAFSDFPLWDTTDSKEGILNPIDRPSTSGQSINKGQPPRLDHLLSDLFANEQAMAIGFNGDMDEEDEDQPSTSQIRPKKSHKKRVPGAEEEDDPNAINFPEGEDGMFACPKCDRKFEGPKGVASHYYVHESIKCKEEGCGQNIKRHNYFKHMKAVHSIDVPKSPGGKKPRANQSPFPMKCHIDPACNKILKHKGHVNYHIKMHSGVKPYSCEYCDSKFASISVRFNHIKNVHGELPYPCNLCSQKYGLKAELTQHQYEAHSR